MINTLLVDDQTLVRQGIRSLLELSDNINVVAEVSDGSELLPALSKYAVDVILLDLRMPVMDGVETLEQLNANNISIPVIILTTFDDDERLLKCAQLGARGYMLKDVSFEQLVEGIEKVYHGELLIQTVVTERVLKGLKKHALSLDDNPVAENLTPRETEVLRYMAGGYSNKEIASAVHLSEGTVKNHVSSILAKFGVRDRTRAVMKALDLGLLD